jgi:hypothetical protein
MLSLKLDRAGLANRRVSAMWVVPSLNVGEDQCVASVGVANRFLSSNSHVRVAKKHSVIELSKQAPNAPSRVEAGLPAGLTKDDGGILLRFKGSGVHRTWSTPGCTLAVEFNADGPVAERNPRGYPFTHSGWLIESCSYRTTWLYKRNYLLSYFSGLPHE